MISYKNIEINAWEHNQVQELITQGEGGIKYLYFTLYDNNGVVDLTDATEVIYSATKPDKNAVYNNLEPFDVAFDNTGKVKLKITTGMANIKGVVKGEIQVITPDGVLIFYGIDLKIEKGNGKGVESSNEFTALTKALNKIAILTPEGTVELDDELTDEGTNAVIGGAVKRYVDTNLSTKADYNSVFVQKNLLSLPEYSISKEDNSGISITINENLISVEGTAAEDVRLVFPIENFVLPAGTYSYAVKNLNSDFTTGATIYIKDDNYTNISNVFANQNVNYNKKVFTIAEDTIIAHMSVTVTSGTEIKQTFNLQLEVGETSTDYVSPDERFFGGELTNDVNTLKLATVTASVFGAVGDGETDDTEALQRAIDYCSENYKTLKLESGKIYLISKVLQFMGKSIYFDGNFATIKANTRVTTNVTTNYEPLETKPVNALIYVNCLNINDNYNTGKNEEQNYRQQMIKNIILDCNGVVNDGIRAIRGRKVHFNNIVVTNPVTNGIILNTGGWENMISNIHISRYLESLGGTGIYIEGSDNVIDKVVVIGCQYGVINVGGDNHYSRVHPWSTTKAMENLRNCVSFGCFGSYCTFSQCMGDSTNRIFEFKYNARAMISNCANTWSDGFVKNTDKNPYLFYFVDDEEEKNHTLRGKGVVISSSYFKPKTASDYPEFKTYFSNLDENEEPMFIDKIAENEGWYNAPKSIDTLLNSKIDNSDEVILTNHLSKGSVTSIKIANDSINESKLETQLKQKINTKLDSPDTEGLAGQVLMHAGNGKPVWGTVSGGAGGTGTSNYLELENKPTINNVVLSGNITSDQLGIKDGKDGEDGEDYVLTEDDKQEIANIIKTDYDQELLDILGGD